MSEAIKHECGIALVRLLKPLEYYQEKYGTYQYGLHKLYLLMEKQHNRGQEGAGLACIKLHAQPGEEYIFRERAMGPGAIQEIFGRVQQTLSAYPERDLADVDRAAKHLPFIGEAYMGHLRYSTTGRSGISYVHPFLRRSNWKARNLTLCGNFNLTNVDEVFDHIVAQGQHPRSYSDTFIMLEQIGSELDRESQRLYDRYKAEGMSGLELTRRIETELDMERVLRKASSIWDGGYVICGMTGSGDSFSFRDPQGIRPAYYYVDDEVAVVASERPVIQTTFDVGTERVRELEPGQAILIDRAGQVTFRRILPARKYSACSFERIYFSRGSDADIYRERKQLGRNLVPAILRAVGSDLENTVFSFIPNTAEVAFYGMMEGLNDYLAAEKARLIREKKDTLTETELQRILALRVRQEKVALKDIKLRTFIAEGNTRNDLAAHVYDITYGTVRPGIDNLVVIDDSIVRGTTLKQSIIKILDRLRPKKIVIVSSSPQVRYPDCYGIDMSRMGEFAAFRAVVELCKEKGREDVLADVYRRAKEQQSRPKEEIVNYVKEIYALFTEEEIAGKITRMLTPEGTHADVQIVYQTLEGLQTAIPDYPGNWYFSGDYPTPGGNRLVNNAFVNFMEGADSKRSMI